MIIFCLLLLAVASDEETAFLKSQDAVAEHMKCKVEFPSIHDATVTVTGDCFVVDCFVISEKKFVKKKNNYRCVLWKYEDGWKCYSVDIFPNKGKEK